MDRKRGKVSKDLNITSITTSIRRGFSSKDSDKSSPTTSKKEKRRSYVYPTNLPPAHHDLQHTTT